jgi:ribose/xylose/arabinose/galactoside ABC-type transport system permease subunit
MESQINVSSDIQKKRKNLTFRYKQSYALWVALFILLIVGTLSSPYFFTPNNMMNVLLQASVVGLLAMGLTIVLITGSLDFTVGAVVALTSVTVGLMQESSIWLTVLVLLCIAIGVGLVNSFVVSKLRLEALIATLSISLVIDGIALFISNSQTIPISTSFWRTLGTGSLFGIPLPVIIFILVGLLLYFLLSRTVLGRYLYATGGNPTASKMSGIPIQKIQIIAFLLSSLIAVLAGIIFAGRISSGDPGVGLTMTLDAVIIAVLGGAMLTGGKGSIQGAIAGALVITVLFNIFNLLSFPVYAQNIARGIIMIGAIAMQRGK